METKLRHCAYALVLSAAYSCCCQSCDKGEHVVCLMAGWTKVCTSNSQRACSHVPPKHTDKTTDASELQRHSWLSVLMQQLPSLQPAVMPICTCTGRSMRALFLPVLPGGDACPGKPYPADGPAMLNCSLISCLAAHLPQGQIRPQSLSPHAVAAQLHQGLLRPVSDAATPLL